ncbi:MAG: MOSC domain-containing protein [Gammaproteobacteria bacterium]|nr:MAG: MOSC domain-containing protein [Gammaproteobacteria bacterium]
MGDPLHTSGPPRVRCVLAGPVRRLGGVLRGTRSGIAKQPVAGPWSVGHLGLAGDEQADLKAHGGEYKAVHCYAWSNYEYWRSVLPDQPLWQAPGAFGENLSLDGIDEHGVCIGDLWRIGSVLFTVTQGRQPCYKLKLRFGVADMPQRVQDSLRAGWYLRVLEPGLLQAGDACTLVERPHPDYSVARLLALIRDRETRPEHLAGVLGLPLTPSWRRLFEGRLGGAGVEDWRPRLDGR